MRRHIRSVVGITLSILLLVWVMRDVSPASVMREIRDADPVLFGLAVLTTLGGFWFRAVRWGLYLRPVAPGVPFRPRFAATMVGFAANNVLPARVGEFARALALTRLSAVPLGASVATLVVERLFDALVVVGLLFAVMATPDFPVGDIAGIDPRAAARVIALAMAGIGVALGALVVAPARSVALAETVAHRLLPGRLRHPILAAVRSFIGGLGVLRSGRLFAASVALAAGQWLFTAVAFLLAFRAFDIQAAGLGAAVFLQSLIALAVAVPSSPGFFGPWQAAARVGLGLWGVPADKAVSFAVGFHLGGFLPTTLIGIYYVWRLNLSWREVQHSEEVVEEAVEPDPAAGPVAPEGA